MAKIKFNDLSQDEVKRLFLYDDKTGNLIWQCRPRSDFKTESGMKSFNTQFVGKIAGGYHMASGYMPVRVGDKRYKAHRLIWIYHHGAIPEGMMIDHIDNSPRNNRISNLRLATHSQNCRNCGATNGIISGRKGVHYHKVHGYYTSQIRVDGKAVYLGKGTAEHCAKLYAEAANLYYGEFARIA